MWNPEARYGASSLDDRIAIAAEDNGETFRLRWQERDGPPLTAPQTRGFGVTLLASIGQDEQIDFSPDGLRFAISLEKC